MSTAPLPMPQEGDYVWELATLYPEQGGWSEGDYLSLCEDSNGRAELRDKRLELLPTPTWVHEAIAQYLLFALHGFVTPKDLGKVFASGIRVRLRPGLIRLPDILFLRKERLHLAHNRVWDAADLVMEVVSDDARDQRRDYKDKLGDYAAGGVEEYWIVDPERRTVEVHRLAGGAYAPDGTYSPGQQASSVLLPGFAVDVAELFAAIEDIPE